MSMTLTEFLAIYASVVSTSVFLWNIHQSRARIKVDILGSSRQQGGKWINGVTVIVQNRSPHKVHLSCVWLMYHRPITLRFRLAHYWRFKRFTRMVGWIQIPLDLLDVQDKQHIEGLGQFQLEGRQAHQVFVPRAVIDHVVGAPDSKLKGCVQDQLGRMAYSRRTHHLELRRA